MVTRVVERRTRTVHPGSTCLAEAFVNESGASISLLSTESRVYYEYYAHTTMFGFKHTIASYTMEIKGLTNKLAHS